MNSYEIQSQKIQRACEAYMEDRAMSQPPEVYIPLDHDAAVEDVAKRTGLPVGVVRAQAAAYFAQCI